jgi:hypothetical protein
MDGAQRIHAICRAHLLLQFAVWECHASQKRFTEAWHSFAVWECHASGKRGSARGRKGGIRSEDFRVQDIGLRFSALGFKFEDRKSLWDTSSPSACSDAELISFSQFFSERGEKTLKGRKWFFFSFRKNFVILGSSSFRPLFLTNPTYHQIPPPSFRFILYNKQPTLAFNKWFRV